MDDFLDQELTEMFFKWKKLKISICNNPADMKSRNPQFQKKEDETIYFRIELSGSGDQPSGTHNFIDHRMSKQECAIDLIRIHLELTIEKAIEFAKKSKEDIDNLVFISNLGIGEFTIDELSTNWITQKRIDLILANLRENGSWSYEVSPIE